MPGRVGSQVRRSLILPGLSAARIPRWDLWPSGPGCCRPGSITIATAPAAQHPPPRAGSQGHYSPRIVGTRGVQPCMVPQQSQRLPSRRASARRSMGSQGLCLGGHRDNTVAGRGAQYGAQGGQGPASPHSAPQGQHRRVRPGGHLGTKSPGVTPSAYPTAMPQPCMGPGCCSTQTRVHSHALHPQTLHKLCRAHPVSSVTGVPGGSHCRARASQGGDPGALEPAGQGHPWSRC